MILDRIIDHKRREIELHKREKPLRTVIDSIEKAPEVRDFAGGLELSAAKIPAVIAEVKKASPSKGIIRPDFDPEQIAKSYENAGASAISVLTDEEFFHGSLDYLTRVRNLVGLPVIRKDFIIDEYQVYEARAAGADAVLLIVAALEFSNLESLMRRICDLGMIALVEVHNDDEMKIALELGAKLIGINNRNLQTFEVSLETTERLLPIARDADAEVKIVSESGIFTRNDMERLGGIGIDAVLIGEALMRESDVESKLKELLA